MPNYERNQKIGQRVGFFLNIVGIALVVTVLVFDKLSLVKLSDKNYTQSTELGSNTTSNSTETYETTLIQFRTSTADVEYEYLGNTISYTISYDKYCKSGEDTSITDNHSYTFLITKNDWCDVQRRGIVWICVNILAIIISIYGMTKAICGSNKLRQAPSAAAGIIAAMAIIPWTFENRIVEQYDVVESSYMLFACLALVAFGLAIFGLVK